MKNVARQKLLYDKLALIGGLFAISAKNADVTS